MIWLHALQYCGFFTAQFMNGLLVYLIMTKAEKLFGSYRHVMVIFALYSLTYAWVEILTQPILHIKGPVFVVSLSSPIKYEKWIGNNVACLFCGSFALVISLLASQFFYRYVAMCKPESLPLITGGKLVFIFIPCPLLFILWFQIVYWGMPNTPEKQEYLRDDFQYYYDEDSSKVSFIAAMYWSEGENGEKNWKIWECLSSVGCTMIIVTCYSVILFCAFKIYSTMKKAKENMSARTLEMNKQLFRTLTLQTLLPCIIMYIPVGLFITVPVFNIPIGKYANIAAVTAAVYPTMEPIVAMVCIRDFRRVIFCQKSSKVHMLHSAQTATG